MTWVRWNLNIVLTWINIFYIFIWDFFPHFLRTLLNLFAHYLLDHLFFGIKILKFFMDSGYLPHTRCILGKYFLHSVSSISTQTIASFAVPKPLSFRNLIYQLQVFPLLTESFWKNPCIYLYLRVHERLWIPLAGSKFQETHIYSCI